MDQCQTITLTADGFAGRFPDVTALADLWSEVEEGYETNNLSEYTGMFSIIGETFASAFSLSDSLPSRYL